ncbi:hypothetical protein ABZY58_12040 [Micromonospora tulbaghiae]|uniref:hypothetical protein n=1 Tax=Micromonospora tulbaghiae TaxID=479978 RepID=UPI0033BD725F
MQPVVKAISVRQPWTGCIATNAAGAKRIENRGFATTYRGRLYIHAATAADVQADSDPRVTALWGRDPRIGWPVGAVTAVAELVDVHVADDIPTLTGLNGTCCEPWGERVYNGRLARHLVLAERVQVLDRPVHCRGALGLWTPPADVIEQVEKQIAAQVEAEAAEAVNQ